LAGALAAAAFAGAAFAAVFGAVDFAAVVFEAVVFEAVVFAVVDFTVVRAAVRLRGADFLAGTSLWSPETACADSLTVAVFTAAAAARFDSARISTPTDVRPAKTSRSCPSATLASVQLRRSWSEVT
jgi:hypothetical protein